MLSRNVCKLYHVTLSQWNNNVVGRTGVEGGDFVVIPATLTIGFLAVDAGKEGVIVECINIHKTWNVSPDATIALSMQKIRRDRRGLKQTYTVHADKRTACHWALEVGSEICQQPGKSVFDATFRRRGHAEVDFGMGVIVLMGTEMSDIVGKSEGTTNRWISIMEIGGVTEWRMINYKKLDMWWIGPGPI